MEYTIKNEHMQATITDAGAQLISLQKDGTEYLWQGDPAFWKEHAPILFPFEGRLYNEQYTVHGRPYSMQIHGFAKKSAFYLVDKSEESVTFGLSDNDETMKIYPFHFDFQATYTLTDNLLQIGFQVLNLSEETMFFGLGGHPGFNVPLEEGTTFEDWYLEFSEKCQPDQVVLTDHVLVSEQLRRYALEDDTKLPLHHDLFDHDAIVLTNIPDTVTLKSDKSDRSVTVIYPQMPYLGLWHAVKTTAPYLAIEPWVSIPAREGVVEEFSSRGDLVRLEPSDTYENVWGIALN